MYNSIVDKVFSLLQLIYIFKAIAIKSGTAIFRNRDIILKFTKKCSLGKSITTLKKEEEEFIITDDFIKLTIKL